MADRHSWIGNADLRLRGIFFDVVVRRQERAERQGRLGIAFPVAE